MNEIIPAVSLIIAARPGQADIKAAWAGRKLDYPREKMEILIARGNQPAIQRNAAIRQAHGDLIYFLDDDSVPPPQNLRRVIPYLNKPEVQMVGGPNLCPPDAPMLEQVFALVTACWLAFGPSRARYMAVGKLRETGEKELILCNLVARRSTLLALGGFDESLYPNEENALMDDLQRQGGKMLYDPEFYVYRRPRRSLRAFVRMLMTYGRGRAEQFRLHPTLGSALNFAPPLFCLYLLATVCWRGLLLWPWLFYTLALVIQVGSFEGPGLLIRALTMPLIFLTHLFYGLGFWRGLFTKLAKSKTTTSMPVILEQIPL